MKKLFLAAAFAAMSFSLSADIFTGKEFLAEGETEVMAFLPENEISLSEPGEDASMYFTYVLDEKNSLMTMSLSKVPADELPPEFRRYFKSEFVSVSEISEFLDSDKFLAVVRKSGLDADITDDQLKAYAKKLSAALKKQFESTACTEYKFDGKILSLKETVKNVDLFFKQLEVYSDDYMLNGGELYIIPEDRENLYKELSKSEPYVLSSVLEKKSGKCTFVRGKENITASYNISQDGDIVTFTLKFTSGKFKGKSLSKEVHLRTFTFTLCE